MISKKRLKNQAHKFKYALKRELKKFNHEIWEMAIEDKIVYFAVGYYELTIKIDEKGLTDECVFEELEIIIDSVQELASMIDDIIFKIKNSYDFCTDCNGYFHEEYEPCECVYDDPVASFWADECYALWLEINRF